MMIGLPRLVGVAIACLLVAGCGTTAAQTEGPTTYVYGDFAFDLALELEKAKASPINFGLEDCSDSATHCLRGRVFKLSTPTDCASFHQGVFGHGDVETRVLKREAGPSAVEKSPPHHYPSPVWLLGSPDRPHIVYVYSAAGVLGLYQDAERDVVAIALEQGLEGLRALGAAPDAAYAPLLSFQPWGGCRGRIEPSPVRYQGPRSPIP